MRSPLPRFFCSTVIVALLTTNALAPASAATSLPEVTIGVELPLAGDAGWRGLAAQSGIELAVDDWNAQPNAPMRLRIRLEDSSAHIDNPHQDEGSDDAFQSDRAAKIAETFADDPQIVVMIGAVRADVALAEASVANKRGLPLLSGTSTPAGMDASQAAFFRVAPGDEAQGRLAAALAHEESFHHVGIATRLTQRASAARQGLGAMAVPEQHADAVLFVAPTEAGAVLASRTVAEELERADLLRLMEHRGFEYPRTGEYDAMAAAVSLDTPAGRAFTQRFQKRFVAAPSPDATFAYVAVQIAASAIASSTIGGKVPTRAEVLAALHKGHFATIIGDLHFDHAGAVTPACFAVTRVVDGAQQTSETRCIATLAL